MKISDELLMGFADDELDAATRAEVEMAMRDDPGVAKRIDEHRALRSALQKAFAPQLEEVPPERLIAAARGAVPTRADATVVSLDAARKAATRKSSGPAKPVAWRTFGSLAASLALGIGLGVLLFHRSNAILLKPSGGLVADGALARALSDGSGSSVDSSGTVQIGLSFVAKSGNYCRTFTLTKTPAPSGLACREGGDWQIQLWSATSTGAAHGGASENYQPAGSAMPTALVNAVEERIVGDPLDQAGEAAALRQGWQVKRP